MAEVDQNRMIGKKTKWFDWVMFGQQASKIFFYPNSVQPLFINYHQLLTLHSAGSLRFQIWNFAHPSY